jgi:hypothetical protein
MVPALLLFASTSTRLEKRVAVGVIVGGRRE